MLFRLGFWHAKFRHISVSIKSLNLFCDEQQMRMTAMKKKPKHSPFLKAIKKKWRKKYLELGWELQSTEGLIFILILLGKGNRGSRTWPNESVIQPKQMCWHDSGPFQKYQDSFWLWNTCWSALSESLKGGHFRARGLRLLWCKGKVDNASYFNQTMSKDPEQSNLAPLPFMPYITSPYSTRRSLSQWKLEQTWRVAAVNRTGRNWVWTPRDILTALSDLLGE